MLTRTATTKTAPPIVAIVAPGGAFVRTDSHTPATPSAAVSATVASCHERIRLVHSRVVTAGMTSSAVASRAPTAASAATEVNATSASSARSVASAPVRGGSKPTASQRCPISSVATSAASDAAAAKTRSVVPIANRLPNRSVSTSEPEWKTSDARITPSASAPTSTSAVAAS